MELAAHTSISNTGADCRESDTHFQLQKVLTMEPAARSSIAPKLELTGGRAMLTSRRTTRDMLANETTCNTMICSCTADVGLVLTEG